MNFTSFIFLIFTVTITSARIYSIENPDGSYTIGHTSDSRGESENSVVALLTKAAGYTLDEDFENSSAPTPSNAVFRAESNGLLTPHMEILQLLEVFLRFKGEFISKLNDLVSDNYDLIRSVYQTVINKIGTLHTFTLVGIRILRKLLEFAVTLMVNWQVNLPNFSLGVNVGQGDNNQNTIASLMSSLYS